ncbi:MAG: hypothetical protein M3R18_05090 [Pseudomonadota bacterium]|nr:hypothetical protein [Pseudomonadota bacterium]
MRTRLDDLWNGRVPLARVFWDYAVIYGSFANLVATGSALAIIVLGWPAVIVVVLFLLPVPYNFLMVVAVWRSAGHYQGDPKWASLARGAILVWAAIATLA